MRTSFTSKYFWAVFVLLASGLCWIMFSNKYLPMVDLPQYAAQIFILRDLQQTDSFYSAYYHAQWFSPYVLSVALCYGLSFFTSVITAVKITIVLSMLALPLSLIFLLKKSGGYVWWSLLGFPLAFGFSFAWGFVSTMMALPLGLLFLGFIVEEQNHPRKIFFLLTLATIIFFTHLFVFMVVMAIWIIDLAFQKPKQIIFGLFCFVLPFLWLMLRQKDWSNSEPFLMGNWSLARIKELPSNLVSDSTDTTSAAFGLLLLSSLLWIKPDWEAFPKRAVVFILGCICFFISPTALGWFYLIYQRFSFFIFVGLMLWLKPMQTRQRKWHPFVYTAIALTWLGIQNFRIVGFNLEAEGFDTIVEKMEPGKKICALMIDNSPRFTSGFQFLHFPVWTVLTKKSLPAFSFAIFPNWIIQYNKVVDKYERARANEVLWYPYQFRWAVDGEAEYYLSRSSVDPAPLVFSSSRKNLELIEQSGFWWLYRRKKLESPS